MEWRIGVHLGTYWSRGRHPGDGVTSGRLESMAEPGGICISDDAFRQVRGKIEADLPISASSSDIARPLRVYRFEPSLAPGTRTPPTALPFPTSRQSRCCRSPI